MPAKVGGGTVRCHGIPIDLIPESAALNLQKWEQQSAQLQQEAADRAKEKRLKEKNDKLQARKAARTAEGEQVGEEEEEEEEPETEVTESTEVEESSEIDDNEQAKPQGPSTGLDALLAASY